MKQEQEIFEQAMALPSREAREGYLIEACGQNRDLRRSVDELLAAFNEAGEIDFLKGGDRGPEGRTVSAGVRPEEGPGTVIGRYKLLQKIGEGGMGVVYMAEQEEPVRRRLALKIIKLGMDTKSVIARFEAERQALARMDHPNIAKVLDGGATDTGRPFFVMELVRGVKITEYCDEATLPTRDRLELFTRVCQAVQHAHQKGIIHRDLKPSNILVTLNDGVAVPKVIDFGVAKATEGRLTDKTLLTQFEALIGTPAYMSPEQALMTSLDIDTRSDIYSLGVLLYELLAGSTPFDASELMASGFDAMRQTIREREPVRPSTRLATLKADEQTSTAKRRSSDAPRLIHLLSGDLDWIVMKCLEKDRTRRYETANGLARDIERHLNHEPITARPIGRAGRMWRWCRREPEVSALGGLVLLLLLALAVGSTVAFWRINKARAAERLERQQAETARNQLALSVNEMEIREIHRAEEWFETGDSPKAVAHLALLLRQSSSNYIAGQRLMSALTELHLAHPVMSPFQHHERLTWAQFSHDGRLIVTTSADATARVWETDTGRSVGGPFAHEQEVNSADFSPDGQWLVTASMDNTARVWEIRTGNPLSPPLVHQGDVWNAHFSPDGHWVVTASMDGTARVWEVGTGRPRFPPLRCEEAVFNAEFSPEGDRVLTASLDRTARVWNAISGNLLVTIKHAMAVRSARFSPDGRWVVTSSDDKTARVWDARNGQPICPVMEHNDRVDSVEFSPDGRWVATASYDQTARVWDARTGQPISPLLKHGHYVRSVQFSPDGLRLITTSWDKTARVWDAQTGAAITEPLVHEAHVFWAEFHPDGCRVLTVCNGTGALLWNVSIPPASPTVLRQQGILTSTDFSFDGKRVAISSDSGAYIWAAESAAPEKTILSDRGVSFVTFSRDGHWLATAAGDRAQIWDALTGAPVGLPLTHSNHILRVRFSPDGRRVVTASLDKTARVWDARTGEPITAPLRHQGPVMDAQFSPDGIQLVTASGDEFDFNAGGHRLVTAPGEHAARLWDASTGQQLFLLQHADEVNSAQFSPDGRSVLTSCHYAVQIWDAHTGQPRFPPLRYTDLVLCANFSRDGTKLVTGSSEGTVRVLEALSGKTLTTLATGMKANVPSAELSADSQRVLAVLGDGRVRLWDVGTGLPLTEGLPRAGEGLAAKFSPDERWVLMTAKEQPMAYLWDVPIYPPPVPAWLPELAEALAGQRVDALGRAGFVSCQNVLPIKQKLQQSPSRDAYEHWARWFFSEDSSRTLSPNSHITSAQ